MNSLVKIIKDDDGNDVKPKVWHLYFGFWSGSNSTLCSLEVFGAGESAVEYKLKESKKGGVTCQRCKEIINELKSVKL